MQKKFHKKENKLCSNEKLRLKSEFSYIRDNGVKYIGNLLLLIAAESIDNELKFGIICGKKFNNKAVKRNRARRLIKEAFRRIKKEVKPTYIVFIPKKKILNFSMQDVQGDMKNLLKESKLLRTSTDDQ